MEPADEQQIGTFHREHRPPRAHRPNGESHAAAKVDGDIDDPPLVDLAVELGAMRDGWVPAETEIANVRTRARREVEDARQR